VTIRTGSFYRFVYRFSSHRDSAIVRAELPRRRLSQCASVTETALDGGHPFVAIGFRRRLKSALLILSVIEQMDFALLIGAHAVFVRREVKDPALVGRLLLLDEALLFVGFVQNERVAFELHKVTVVVREHRLFGDPALLIRNVVVLRESAEDARELARAFG